MQGRTLGLLLLALAGSALLVRALTDDGDAGRVDPGAREAATAGGAGPALEGRADATAAAEPSPPHDATAPDVSPPAEVAGGRVLLGRVVDARRRPVPGTRVRARGPGHPEVTATADRQGAFRLALGPPSGETGPGLVHAFTTDGRAGSATFWVPPTPVTQPTDLGVLVLGPARDLDVRVERDGAPVAGARLLVDAQRDLGQGGRIADLRTDASGRARLTALPLGPYRLAAGAPGHGRGLAELRLKAEGPAEAVVALSPPREFVVRVIEQEAGTPVVGATVRVTEHVKTGRNSVRVDALEPIEPLLPTDAQGRTRLVGLAPGDGGSLSATAPGFPEPLQAGWGGEAEARFKPEDAEATIPLRRLKTISWPLAEGGAAPPEGTPLTFEASTGAVPSTRPATGRIEGGRVVGDGFSHGYVHAVAVAPDGAFAMLFAKANESEGLPATFLPARRIDVRVLAQDGTPLSGQHVWARNQGNNPLPDDAVTDAEGRATLRPRYAHLVEVFVGPRREEYGGRAAGSVDLARGDGSLEVRLPADRELRLKVTLDGEPGLPGQFHVGMGMGPLPLLSEDPDQGLLVLRVALPEVAGPTPPVLWLNAVGFAPAQVPLQAPAGAGPIEAAVALERGCALEVRVALPADGQSSVSLERWDEGGQRWGFSTGGGLDGNGSTEQAPGLAISRFEPLKPGRYRVRDRATGEASDPVELRGAGASAAVSLDLSRSGFVKGTLELPEGFEAQQAEVRLEGVDDGGPMLGGRVGRGHVWNNGTFQIRVPGTRPVRLVARHPLLVPDPVAGRLEATGPREGARLKLVQGASARFTLAGAAPPPQRNPVGEGPRALLFEGAPTGEPRANLSLVGQAGAWRFAGYEPGTYTLWLDLGQGAPILMRGVVLGPAETDLGELTPPAGSSIRLKVKVKEGVTAPRLSIWARTEGPPGYVRQVTSRGGETELVLTGLGPGRFQVGAAPVMAAFTTTTAGPAQKLDATVEADGANETVLELDLR